MYKQLIKDLKGDSLKPYYEGIKVYTDSLSEYLAAKVVMIRQGTQKFLLAAGSGALYDDLIGYENNGFKLAFPTHENRLVLNKYFPYTAPVANTEHRTSVGLGDRLGLATPGHIRAVKDTDVFPVFAQQSVRELDMTHRKYEDVIDAASYAVFQEGYKKGFGADGDHLKTKEDILKELDLGATMITLDSSEKIDNTILDLSDEELLVKYEVLDPSIRSYYEDKYLDKDIAIEGLSLSINKKQLMRDVLTYYAAINFIREVYEEIIVTYKLPLDFEISIDETATPTNPISHYIIAQELKDRNILISTMAPRFIGEFQKGIDYIGDLEMFTQDIRAHVAIAEHFGYRISVHSGSDKFSIFPIVAKETHGKFHVKTAGTNWLEAIEVISEKEPAVYREIHAHALERFSDATALYHVTTNLANIPSLHDVEDSKLPDYLKNNDARQLLHITYGYILRDQDEQGNFLLRERFFDALDDHMEDYTKHLDEHISKHLSLLNLK